MRLDTVVPGAGDDVGDVTEWKEVPGQAGGVVPI
jgi:hypothetical protein